MTVICLEYSIPIPSGNPTGLHAHGKLPNFSEYHCAQWKSGAADTAPPANKAKISPINDYLESLSVLLGYSLLGYPEVKDFS